MMIWRIGDVRSPTLPFPARGGGLGWGSCIMAWLLARSHGRHAGGQARPALGPRLTGRRRALAAIEIGGLGDVRRQRRDEPAGRGIGQRVAVERLVVLVDVIA